MNIHRNLFIRCDCCDDLIFTKYVTHGTRSCSCGRIFINADSEELIITFNGNSDGSYSVHVIDLDQKRMEISRLYETVDLYSLDQKRYYYEQALSFGVDDDIKKLDIEEIRRLLPQLSLPKLIRDMWLKYFDQ